MFSITYVIPVAFNVPHVFFVMGFKISACKVYVMFVFVVVYTVSSHTCDNCRYYAFVVFCTYVFSAHCKYISDSVADVGAPIARPTFCLQYLLSY
jgi:hypothetical protein